MFGTPESSLHDRGIRVVTLVRTLGVWSATCADCEGMVSAGRGVTIHDAMGAAIEDWDRRLS